MRTGLREAIRPNLREQVEREMNQIWRILLLPGLVLLAAGQSFAAPADWASPAVWRSLDWRMADGGDLDRPLASGAIPGRRRSGNYEFEAEKHGDVAIGGLPFEVEKERHRTDRNRVRFRAENKDDLAACTALQTWGQRSFGPGVVVDRSVEMSEGGRSISIVLVSQQWDVGATRVTHRCYGLQAAGKRLQTAAIEFEDVLRADRLRPLTTVSCKVDSGVREHEFNFRIDDNEGSLLRLDNSPIDGATVGKDLVEFALGKDGEKVTLSANRLTGTFSLASEKTGHLGQGSCAQVDAGGSKF
jgi:hypothetical protein